VAGFGSALVAMAFLPAMVGIQVATPLVALLAISTTGWSHAMKGLTWVRDITRRKQAELQLQQALADAETQANSELGSEAASVIRKQIANIQTKGVTGEIDGQTAYNIKKALDRIGSGSSDAAFYARDLKKKLMAALNDSLGPQEAAAFAKTRQQYGNMLALENLAQNGAEGGISAARLANMKNIGNDDLQELADIAAQFMRTRESPHGALQRLVIGGTAAGAGGVSALPVLAGTAVAGRGANSILNSQAAKNAALMALARRLRSEGAALAAANAKDIEAAQAAGLSHPTAWVPT
jgi:hypothetical protein